MKKVKSFIYLDEYKLYSISSQLFEGLTEYIVHTHSQNQNEEESQKGPIGSGRVLADIFREEHKTEERKNLYDYAFNILEDELTNNEKVIKIDDTNYNSTDFKDFTFIKVIGKAIFNDMNILSKTVEEFNKIGEALGYLSTYESFEKQKQEMNEEIKQIKDRNQRAKAKQMINKSNKAFKEYLEENNLILDETFISHLKYILDFGYQGQFEIKIPFGEEDNKHLFSSILNRKYLKEDEFELISKYSRKTEKKFTIFGILTQNERIIPSEELDNEEDFEDREDSTESSIMKEAILNLVDKLSGVENTFTGRLSYEYIIDPIAVYREI